MPLILKILAVYLLAANVVAFVAFGIDKRKARKGRWRTPERTLMTMAAVGGALGAWLGMKAFHHKTLHRKFRYGVPALLIAWLALLGWLTYKVLFE